MKLKFFVLISLFWLLNSCEKKIILHPENSEQKLSVEAIFSDSPFVSYVRVTKSKSIYQPITGHEQITDADVKIIDLTTNDTIPFVYNDDSENYKAAAAGLEGRQYRLDIMAQGHHLTSTKTMMTKVNLDRVISVPTEEDPNVYYLKMQFNDPPEQQDYYLIIIQPIDPNSELEPRFSVMSDITYDRVEKTISITDEFFNKDEDWMVLFFHIDRENFNYFKVIHRAMKNLMNGAHPFYGLSLGNPQSTIDGDQTLGYFITSPVMISPIRIGN